LPALYNLLQTIEIAKKWENRTGQNFYGGTHN